MLKYETEICICCSLSAFEKFRKIWGKYKVFKPDTIMINKEMTIVAVRLKFIEWDEESSAVKEFKSVVESLCEDEFNNNDNYAFNYIKIGKDTMDDEQSFNLSGKKFCTDFYIDRTIHIPDDDYIEIK